MNRNLYDPTAWLMIPFGLAMIWGQIALGMWAPTVTRDQLGTLGR
jgi:hypothetical protein